MEASKKKSRDTDNPTSASMCDSDVNKGGSEFTQEGPYKKYRFDGNTKEEQILAVTEELNALEKSLAHEGQDGSSLQHADGDLSLALKPCVEVFVGGLPPDIQEDAVKEAFSAVGDVLGVKIFKKRRSGECRGYGYVSFPDIATAEKACQQVREVAGTVIGVHVSRGKATQDLPDLAQGPPPVPVQSCDAPDASINQLLTSLRKQNDKVAAVAAALKAAATSARRRTPARPSAPSTPGAATTDAAAGVQPADDIPDNYLDSFPKCKKLVEQFRSHPNTHNKTPLAILHEYATRLGLELNYEEKSDTPLGPFVVDARLSSVGGAILYASGTGKGRNKKDAKQYAASAVLEVLLQNVPESEFMHPGKAKQAKGQATTRPSHVSDVNTIQLGSAHGRNGGNVAPFSAASAGAPHRTARQGPPRTRLEGPSAGGRGTSMGSGGRFSGRTRTYSQYSQPSYPQGGNYQQSGGYGPPSGGFGQQSGFGAGSTGAGMGSGFGSQQPSSFGPTQSGYSAGTANNFQQSSSYQTPGSYPQVGYQSSGGYPQSSGYHSGAGFPQQGYGLPDSISPGDGMGVGRGGMGNPMMSHEGAGMMGARPDPYGSGYNGGAMPMPPVTDSFGRQAGPEPYGRTTPVDPYARGPAVDPYARATADGYGRTPEPYHRSPVPDSYGRPPGPPDMYPRPIAPADPYAPRTTPTQDMYGRGSGGMEGYGRGGPDAFGRTPGADAYARSPCADSYNRPAVPDSYGRGYGGVPGAFPEGPSADYAVMEPQHKRNMRSIPPGSATPPTAGVGNLTISPAYAQEGGHMYGATGGMQQNMGGEFNMGTGPGGYSNGYGGEFGDMHAARGVRPSQHGGRGAGPGQQLQQQQQQGRLMRP